MPDLTQYYIKSEQNATLEAIRQLKKLQASDEKDFLINELRNFLELATEPIHAEVLNTEYREMLKRIDIFLLKNLVDMEKEYRLRLIAILPLLAWNIAARVINSKGRKRFNLDIDWFAECLGEFTFDFSTRIRSRYSKKLEPTNDIIQLITISSSNIVYMYHFRTTGTKAKHFGIFSWFEKIAKDGKSKGLTDEQITRIAETESLKKFKQFLDLSKAYNRVGGFENRLSISLDKAEISEEKEIIGLFQDKDPDTALMLFTILEYQIPIKGKLKNLFTDKQLYIIKLFLGIEVKDNLSIVRVRSLQSNRIAVLLNLNRDQMEYQMELIADKIFYLWCITEGIPVEEFIGTQKGKIPWKRVNTERCKCQKRLNRVFTLG